MPLKLKDVLRNIGKACNKSGITEAEVEKIFQANGFFTTLGYEGFGIDLQAQRGRSRKRFDVALVGFGGRVHAVVEFKKLAAGSLSLFRNDLLDKYVKPHLALYGVLTNGVEMVIYARSNGHFPEQLSLKLEDVTDAQALDITAWLQKQAVDMESLDSVLERLRYHRQNVLSILDPDSEAARIFFQVFQLRPESSFGRLVLSLKRTLLKTCEASRFARGSYDFWHRTYARDLSYKNTPASWREFLEDKTKAEIARFSFALETAYSIISRLILAKAANDKGFPGVRFVPRLQESFSELAVRGKLTPDKHREVVERCFKRASEVLFATIFLQDIFDWWEECPVEHGSAVFHALGEAILTVTQFDFLELQGDLLGELYQRYFDRDTRKALGEFYTPGEVIEFILDECGYRGQRGDRLLDPSCGSGSFLAAALRRYLKNNSLAPKEALQDLTDGFRIVGFDINPFAVLMAQMNYAALILSTYAEAIQEDRDFRILRLPVFRTDSLRVEEREEDGGGPGGTPKFRFGEKTLDLSIYLPIKGEKRPFHKVFVTVPRYHDVRYQNLVSNIEEYVAALACVFQAVRDRRHSLSSLLRARFGNRTEKLEDYLKPTLHLLESTVAELKGKFDDGRFLKTIEDLVLAVFLKHDLTYAFVVGNPPYVRIQKIPEHVKEYWEGKYEWTEHNYDLYVPFLERVVRSGDRAGWLADGGRLGFILSDRFLNVDYGQKIREELPKSLRVDLVFDLRDTRVFQDALNYPVILIAERAHSAQEDSLEAARVFSSEVEFNTLVAQFRRLRKNAKKATIAANDSLEVFPYPRARLVGKGWWMMPAAEQAVFDKLRTVTGKSVLQISCTSSGGFAGYQTSADSILVLDEIGELKDLLRVRVRHDDDGCDKKPPEVEKGALRPFLFGKDVGRWAVDWKRSWVIFPYDRFVKKQTLSGELIEAWNLIPTSKNVGEFEFFEPSKIVTLEKRFPNAWKYLCNHEHQLRAREDGRYAENKPEGLVWYAAAYPRSLDYYFRPKLVVQLLSRKNSFALDSDGQFVFQAGGKGGGVYGFAPGPDVKNLGALLAFLNSKVVDFLIKQTSSVYGGRFYSYADQFLRDVCVHERILNARGGRLSKIADLLTENAGNRNAKKQQLAAFPSSFEAHLSRYEFDSVRKLAREWPSSAQLSIDVGDISVQKTLYAFEVHYGTQRAFEFEHREHADCLAEALRARDRKSLPLEDVLAIRLPVKPDGCKKLLEALEKARQEVLKISDDIASLDNELNELVYEIYEINSEEQSVIESFLQRYSSVSADSPVELSDDSDDE